MWQTTILKQGISIPFFWQGVQYLPTGKLYIMMGNWVAYTSWHWESLGRRLNWHLPASSFWPEDDLNLDGSKFPTSKTANFRLLFQVLLPHVWINWSSVLYGKSPSQRNRQLWQASCSGPRTPGTGGVWTPGGSADVSADWRDAWQNSRRWQVPEVKNPRTNDPLSGISIMSINPSPNSRFIWHWISHKLILQKELITERNCAGWGLIMATYQSGSETADESWTLCQCIILSTCFALIIPYSL